MSIFWKITERHKAERSTKNTKHGAPIFMAGTLARAKQLVLLVTPCDQPLLLPVHRQFRNLTNGDSWWCGYFGVRPNVCLKRRISPLIRAPWYRPSLLPTIGSFTNSWWTAERSRIDKYRGEMWGYRNHRHEKSQTGSTVADSLVALYRVGTRQIRPE